jgi:plasmid stability protein
MATLNIKDFPDKLHRLLRRRAQEQHRSVAQEVIHLLQSALEPGESRSILELRGLGKELWDGIDASQHVEGERKAWD